MRTVQDFQMPLPYIYMTMYHSHLNKTLVILVLKVTG